MVAMHNSMWFWRHYVTVHNIFNNAARWSMNVYIPHDFYNNTDGDVNFILFILPIHCPTLRLFY